MSEAEDIADNLGVSTVCLEDGCGEDTYCGRGFCLDHHRQMCREIC